MRIIAGQYRRRTLKSPPDGGTRPTTDRTREAVFSMVTARIDLEGASVVDLFAGSAALGLEALSRGAEALVCVEADRRVLDVGRANAQSLDADMKCGFVLADVFSWLKKASGRSYELILADPPYALERISELPELVLPLVKDGGLFILEHDRRVSFEDHPNRLDTRKYGKSAVSIFSPSREA